MDEANVYSFRTAVGGFHKGDVCAYITRLAGEHRQAVEALEQELEALRAENQSLKAQLSAQPQEAPQVSPPVQETMDLHAMEDRELQAYRRAEAAERLACQRAKKLYQDMQLLCDDSAQQILSLDETAHTAMEAIDAQLLLLHDSLERVQGAVQTSAEGLRAMGNLIPDPAEELEATV
jgi:hypothetical protein